MKIITQEIPVTINDVIKDLGIEIWLHTYGKLFCKYPNDTFRTTVEQEYFNLDYDNKSKTISVSLETAPSRDVLELLNNLEGRLKLYKLIDKEITVTYPVRKKVI